MKPKTAIGLTAALAIASIAVNAYNYCSRTINCLEDSITVLEVGKVTEEKKGMSVDIARTVDGPGYENVFFYDVNMAGIDDLKKEDVVAVRHFVGETRSGAGLRSLKDYICEQIDDHNPMTAAGLDVFLESQIKKLDIDLFGLQGVRRIGGPVLEGHKTPQTGSSTYPDKAA